jgi:AcrR family transcriptional regulator
VNSLKVRLTVDRSVEYKGGEPVRSVGRPQARPPRSSVIRRPPDTSGPGTESLTSREKILEVAESLFARRGFAGVGMREVADVVGLGKSSVFHHFRTKLQLYGEVLARVLGRIDERVRPALASDAAPAEKLDRWLDALIDALAEQPATARLLLRSLVEDEDMPPEPTPETELAERTLETILLGVDGLLRAGIESGAFRAVSVPHTLQTLIGVTVYHFASGELGDELLGRSLLSTEEVRRRKDAVRSLLHHGLVA